MSTEWKKDVENPPSQESEDSVSQALADLGMLEQGMTLQDKRDLLNVVRLSKESAEVEEEERKTKDKDEKNWSPSASPKKHSPYLNLSKEEFGSSRKNDIRMNVDSDIFPSMSLSVLNSKVHNSTDSKEHNLSSSLIGYLGNTHSSNNGGSDTKLKSVIENSLNSSTNMNNQDIEDDDQIINPVGDSGNSENNENSVPEREHLGVSNDSELEIIPASAKLKQKDCNGLKKKKDDRERNIDVFSHSVGTSNTYFNRNVKKNQERVPFYFVPEGMDLRNYVAYFKCYVNQYYKKLAVIQKNNIEHLEWGAPITLEMSSSFTNFRSSSMDANSDSASKRYNFRDRCPKPKLVDFTSENSEEGEEEESNDEDIFVFRNKKLPGIKLSTKRKNTSFNDLMSTKKEKKEFPQKKIQDVAVVDDDQGDIKNGDNPEKNISKAKGATSSQPDIVIAEGASMESTTSQFVDVPPSNVKLRRVLGQPKSNGRFNRRKSEPRKNPDIVLLDETRSVQSEIGEGVRCPICWNTFPASDIEEHASECNQYSPDNNSSAKV